MNTPLHQITEDDLAFMEREMPKILAADLTVCNDPLTQRRWDEVRQILSRVRWNYGPPTQVEENA